ncbi:MAG: ABC transporter ATP-binding protein/permease [Acidobacteriota bacterium]|nr:ABC transporter ATP-binding protein/permease [Acidobacteriota bacterium]
MSAHDEEVLGKAYDARLMRRLLAYLRPYKRPTALALLAILVSSALNLLQPWLMKVAIDDHIATGQLAGLGALVAAFFAALVGVFVLEFYETYTLQTIGQRIMFDMRGEIYAHLQRLDLRYYDRNPVGRLMTRVTTDVDALNDLFASGIVTVFGDVLALTGIIVALSFMDWRLALVSFTVLPLIALVTQWFRTHVRTLYRDVRMWVARINAMLQEHITGMSTVQLFGREEASFQRFEAINRGHRDANIDSVFYYAVFYPAIEVISALSSALIIWYGGGRALDGSMSVGALVAFLLYAQRFYRPISDLSEKFNILQAAMASSERVFALLDTPVESAAPDDPVRLRQTAEPLRGHITFDHVWFAYGARPGASIRSHGTEEADSTDWVLRDVSFQLAPGQRLGVVGATGAGKTTIISLLMRFYDVTGGRILIDGVDIREMDLQELRALFGLVLQDVHMFSGSIADNIRLGRETMDEARVKAAAAAVHASGFIEQLPAGYDQPVAERGATLSVGQKQLLSFARALAHDPKVLILDEATSSIDTATERLIRDALRVLMAGRTTIAVAHRLSTIQDMDTILVMHKGELRESGSHQALLARRGIYFRLYQLQYRDQER